MSFDIMHREFCFFPNDFVQTLIEFGTTNPAWCYVMRGPSKYVKVELDTPDAMELLYQESIGSIVLFVGFIDIQAVPIWEKDGEFPSIDMLASYAARLLLPQFNSNKTVLSFGHVDTFDRNQFENEVLAKKLMLLWKRFCKALHRQSTGEYVLQSAENSYQWKDVCVSKNIVPYFEKLKFSQFLDMRPTSNGDFRLVKSKTSENN